MARTKNIELETEIKKDDITTETEIVEEKDIEKEQMKAMIELLQKQMEELKSQPFNITPQVIVQNDKGLSGKKFKVINLMNCELNVSTEPDGVGRVFTFNKYGDSKIINYDQLVNIVSSYPYTMEHGLLYIADKEAVEELGLADCYTSVYTKEVIDELIYLRRESDVDLFIGMEENLRVATSKRIAELINANERFDYNSLREIKNKTGIDIEDIASKIKLAEEAKDTK